MAAEPVYSPIDTLSTSCWTTRHGEPIRTPNAAILGPKVMIIDETAGSGGDLLPWMFRKFRLGPLVGRRTWGGLVGILGFPVLMDGGSVTAPNLAIFTDEGWVVEESAWRQTSRWSKTRPPWPPVRTPSSTGRSRWSSRPWPRTRPPLGPRAAYVPGASPARFRRSLQVNGVDLNHGPTSGVRRAASVISERSSGGVSVWQLTVCAR